MNINPPGLGTSKVPLEIRQTNMVSMMCLYRCLRFHEKMYMSPSPSISARFYWGVSSPGFSSPRNHSMISSLGSLVEFRKVTQEYVRRTSTAFARGKRASRAYMQVRKSGRVAGTCEPITFWRKTQRLKYGGFISIFAIPLIGSPVHRKSICPGKDCADLVKILMSPRNISTIQFIGEIPSWMDKWLCVP